MVSPWKFLARLVSPRRPPKLDAGASEALKPDVLAIAGPIETTVEKSPHIADHLADEELQLVDLSDAASIEPEPSDETHSDVVGIVENDSGKLGRASGIVVQDIGTIVAKVDVPAKANSATRRTHAKKVEAAAVVLQVSPVAATASDEMVRLDEEIAALRGQLASKLRRQNAQLKRMLARFER